MPADTDWGEVYRANVDAVSALARTLDAEQLSRVVPATPDWTVHDVLAHLAGSPADLLADRMDGAPSAAWTARHVDERAARSVDELRRRAPGLRRRAWSRRSRATTARPSSGTARSTTPTCTRRSARERRPRPMWRPVLEAIAPRMLGETPRRWPGCPTTSCSGRSSRGARAPR